MNIIYDTEEKLRGIEKQLEEVGRSICDVRGSAPSFMAINNAISNIQDAIHSAFTMEAE